MLVGSCLAGISFLKGLGFVHAISHMVGAEFDTQHGLTNAIVLPSVLRFNEKVISKKVPIMCQAMNLKNNDFDYFSTFQPALHPAGHRMQVESGRLVAQAVRVSQVP